jgi:hypothetical protein
MHGPHGQRIVSVGIGPDGIEKSIAVDYVFYREQYFKVGKTKRARASYREIFG